jgi:hypothetical protein
MAARKIFKSTLYRIPTQEAGRIEELINKLLMFIKQLLSNDGIISSVRFMAIMTVQTILFVWAFLSLKNNAVLDIPFGVYAVFVTAIIGKVVQKGIEEKQGS